MPQSCSADRLKRPGERKTRRICPSACRASRQRHGLRQRAVLPEFMAAVQQFSRRPLLDQTRNAPMLVINGANDYFVPQADTLVLKVAPKPKSTCYRTLDIVPCWVASRSCRK